MLAPLGLAHPARWDGQAIYDVGMFHGPLFQSLRHVQGWNESGIDAELSDCTLTGFLDRGERPFLLTNPVLLDATGQLAACWVAEQVGTDFNCFPSSIERIEFGSGAAGEGPGIVLRGRAPINNPPDAGKGPETTCVQAEANAGLYGPCGTAKPTDNSGTLRYVRIEFAGYDVKHEWGDGGHNGKHAGAILPEAMRWLWRDHASPVRPRRRPARSG